LWVRYKVIALEQVKELVVKLFVRREGIKVSVGDSIEERKVDVRLLFSGCFTGSN
jgi:hypothetical protein